MEFRGKSPGVGSTGYEPVPLERQLHGIEAMVEGLNKGLENIEQGADLSLVRKHK